MRARTIAEIQFINASTVVSDADVLGWLPGLQQQVTEDFAPWWGRDLKLSFVPKGTLPRPDTWWAIVSDTIAAANAVGYHDKTSSGRPLIHIAAKPTMDAGMSLTVTASHEVLEAGADCQIDRIVQVGRLLYAIEVADAPEDDQFAYSRGGIMVSDFVTPGWFDAPAGAAGPFDFAGHIAQPRQLLPGGYISVLDLRQAHKGWKQLDAAKMAPIGRRLAVPGTRRERRQRQHFGVGLKRSTVKTK